MSHSVEKNTVGFAASQGGRTLIELLIAIVLSLMIVAAVGSLYYFTSQSSRTSQSVSGAEERGRIAAFYLSEPIALAGYGTINSSEMGRRLGNTAMQGPALRACENGRFQAMPSVRLGFPVVDFTCVPSAAPGDSLFVSFQAESSAGAPQGAMTDCLGQAAPLIDGVPTVRNVYSIEQTPGGALEFGCVGNGVSGAFAGLARDVQDFKVFFAFDADAFARAAAGGVNLTARPSTIMTATALNNLWAAQLVANPGLPEFAQVNPWNQVIAVHVCLVVASNEQGVTADGVSRFRPCPTTPAEVTTGTAEVAVNDGVARRTINQVFTLRTRAQAAAGTNFVQ
jgi:type IV pilus assembly protein PilW